MRRFSSKLPIKAYKPVHISDQFLSLEEIKAAEGLLSQSSRDVMLVKLNA